MQHRWHYIAYQRFLPRHCWGSSSSACARSSLQPSLAQWWNTVALDQQTSAWTRTLSRCYYSTEPQSSLQTNWARHQCMYLHTTGRYSLFQSCLEYHRYPNIFISTLYGETLLHRAAHGNQVGIIETTCRRSIYQWQVFVRPDSAFIRPHGKIRDCGDVKQSSIYCLITEQRPQI